MLVYLYDEAGTPIGLKYRNNTYAEKVYDCYFFEKNIFGDIVAIYDENGVKIGSYAYNAWGSSSITIPTEVYGTTAYKILTQFNPFRYRGYYYDTETGLYYLQTRYYNPQWGRFISADSSTRLVVNNDMISFNLYAYNGNSPVMFIDRNGFVAKGVQLPNSLQVLDCLNLMTEEQRVISGETHFYKGVPIIRIPTEDGSSFSFGVIFLSENADENTLQHEYGHVIQYYEMELLVYLHDIVIPSVSFYWLREIGLISNEYNYYSAGWEAEADNNAHVNRVNRGKPYPDFVNELWEVYKRSWIGGVI